MRRLAHLYLRLRGWQFVGSLPNARKFVAIGAPHTSNWDFVVFLATIHHFGIQARFIGKAGLFRWPFGGLMRRLGGIPVRRDRPRGVVEDVAAAFNAADDMALVIAPEGSRSAAPYWRSGFYWMAEAAAVPIVMAFCDYENRRAGIGPALDVTGDVTADMNHVRAFYDGIVGRRPEGSGPIRLRDEVEPTT